MIDVNQFLEDLNEFAKDKDAEELQIRLTGDLDNDRYMIDSPNKANYFLRLLREIQNDVDNVNQMCDAELKLAVERINEFREDRLKTLNSQIRYYETMLRDFTLREIEGTKKKSVKLPYGTLQIKKTPAKYVYDEAVAIKYLAEHIPTLINKKVTASIDKTAIKKAGAVDSNGYLLIDGNVVPGVSVLEQEDKFTVV